MKKIPKKVKKLIAKHKIITFATASRDAKPNVVAVASCGLLNNQILMADCQMKKTLKNLQKNPNVALCVFDKKSYFQIKGKVNYYKKGRWFNLIKKILEGTPYPPKGVLIIKIKEIYNLDNAKRIF